MNIISWIKFLGFLKALLNTKVRIGVSYPVPNIAVKLNRRAQL